MGKARERSAPIFTQVWSGQSAAATRTSPFSTAMVL